MPSLVLIGPAVRPAIGNIQINRHNAFYYVDALPNSIETGIYVDFLKPNFGIEQQLEGTDIIRLKLSRKGNIMTSCML